MTSILLRLSWQWSSLNLPGSQQQGRWRPAHVNSWSWQRWGWAGDRCGSPLPTPPSGLSASHTPWGVPGCNYQKNNKLRVKQRLHGTLKTSFFPQISNFSNNCNTQKRHTLFKTLLTSLANSLEQTSRWNIFPQFETQAPRSYEDIGTNISSDSLLHQKTYKHATTRHNFWLIRLNGKKSLICLTVSACMATWGSLWFTLLMMERRHSLGLQQRGELTAACDSIEQTSPLQQSQSDHECILISKNLILSSVSIQNPRMSMLTPSHLVS